MTPSPRRALLRALSLAPLAPIAARAQPRGEGGGDRAFLAGAARVVAETMARELDRQWELIRRAAAAIEALGTSASPATLRRILNEAQAEAPHTVWIGIADARTGRVTAASQGIIEGWDVGGRDWFQAGRTRDFAGDVHLAQLLQQAIPRYREGEPLRLIDFTTPLRNRAGEVVAVLGSHVDWRWVAATVQNAPVPAGAEVALLGADWKVVAGREGDWAAQAQRFPITPVVQRRDAPSLSWRVIAVPAARLRGG